MTPSRSVESVESVILHLTLRARAQRFLDWVITDYTDYGRVSEIGNHGLYGLYGPPPSVTVAP